MRFILTFFHFRGRCRIQPTFYSTAPYEGVPWSSSCWLNDRLELNNDNEKEEKQKKKCLHELNVNNNNNKNLFEYYIIMDTGQSKAYVSAHICLLHFFSIQRLFTDRDY